VLALRRLQRRPDQAYTRGVSDGSAGPACGLFAWWWLGGFCFAGTIIGLLTLAAVLGSVPFLAFPWDRSPRCHHGSPGEARHRTGASAES
jgi:hypothetical protein